MELELGLKITKTLHDGGSTEFRIAKDRAGPVLYSQETETMFILYAYLKGYGKEDIKININEDGTLIEINGEKLVQEMTMMGLRWYKKEHALRGFQKIFKIPSGVLLDRVKAKFNDDESILTIYMPKSNKGILGMKIEEVTMQHEPENETIELSSSIPQLDPSKMTYSTEEESQVQEEHDKSTHEQKEHSVHKGQLESEGNEIEKYDNNIAQKVKAEECEKVDQIEGTSEERDQECKLLDKMHKPRKEKSKLFSSCFFTGSALVASVVVLFVGFIKSKRQ